jgi:hypothetical protein
MSLLFWGLTFGVVGKCLLAIGILKVHYVMAKERAIGEQVIHSFHSEKIVTFIGIGLIVFGYLIELYFYNTVHLLTCYGAECMAGAFSVIAGQ